jgi:hypothetical protein
VNGFERLTLRSEGLPERFAKSANAPQTHPPLVFEGGGDPEVQAMVSARAIAPVIAVTGLLACVAPALAETSVGERHEAWRSCLSDAFNLQAALSSRSLAADSALRECRDSETAYLSALSHSPLVDDEDVDRVRPALLVRARTWLLSGKPSRSL